MYVPLSEKNLYLNTKSLVPIHQFSFHVLNNLLLQISRRQILGQNCAQPLDAALKDLFLTKVYFV